MSFVIWDRTPGQLMSVRDEVMQELGLRNGQTVGDEIVHEIFKRHLAYIHADIAIRNAAQDSGSRE